MPRQSSNSRTSQSGNTSFSNQTTYGQIHPESNQYIDAYTNWRPQVDPTIGFRAGDAKRRLANSFLNPTGGYSTPQRDEAIRRAGFRDIDQQIGAQMRAGAYDNNQIRGAQLSSLAGLMAPRIAPTSQSGTGTSNVTGQSSGSVGQNLFGNLLDIGLGAAGIAFG